jgi:Paired amphipathic helix repeat
MPEPLPPTSTSSATSEELAFFDRVKKYIGNKQTMNEFLKLCNLFSQDLIGKDVLVHKVSNFIGGNPDLINWFKQFVGYDGREEVIENQPKAPTGRVALSNCRGLGPSYRLLPKRVRTPFLYIFVHFASSPIALLSCEIRPKSFYIVRILLCDLHVASASAVIEILSLLFQLHLDS